jgi:hypothetical protein
MVLQKSPQIYPFVLIIKRQISTDSRKKTPSAGRCQTFLRLEKWLVLPQPKYVSKQQLGTQYLFGGDEYSRIILQSGLAGFLWLFKVLRKAHFTASALPGCAYCRTFSR